MSQSTFIKTTPTAGGSTKVHIAFVIVATLLASLFLAMVAVMIAFSVEIDNLKSDADEDGDVDQQQSIDALASRLDYFNMTMNGISRQANQVVAAQQQLGAQDDTPTPMPTVNASFLEQILEDIDMREELINSTLEELFQLLNDNSSDIEDIIGDLIDVPLFNSTLQTIIQNVFQNGENIPEIASIVQQTNSSLTMQYEQLLRDLADIESIADEINRILSAQISDVRTLVEDTISRLEAVGTLETFPAPSCAAILSSLPSGYYFVSGANGTFESVFCDMSLSCGNTTGGWMRVAEVDFSNTSELCPTGFSERTDGTLRTCHTDNMGCTSIDYSTFGVTYSRVCGRLVGYQLGNPDAFLNAMVGLDDQYLDGWSMTHGDPPRQHIWSFALGATEDTTDSTGCPCNVGSTAVPPAFVGNDYFCDSAALMMVMNTLLTANPMWDGIGCDTSSMCCSFNSPPWFYRELPQPTSDDIELRACQDESVSIEGAVIELIEIYVQ